MNLKEKLKKRSDEIECGIKDKMNSVANDMKQYIQSKEFDKYVEEMFMRFANKKKAKICVYIEDCSKLIVNDETINFDLPERCLYDLLVAVTFDVASKLYELGFTRDDVDAGYHNTIRSRIYSEVTVVW